VAKSELADYVRQDELIVTAEAVFDQVTQLAVVRHFGQRLGMESFRTFFDAVKAGAKAEDLNKIYSVLQGEYAGLSAARSKEAKAEELQRYESEHIADCVLISSEDNFYGVNSTGKLAKFVQWVYVPAVKNAGDEGQEAKNTSFGKLIARAVRTHAAFEQELQTLREETLLKYNTILDNNRQGLAALSTSLQKRLESWAHPNVKIDMAWLTDPGKSVQVNQPVAGIKTGDGDFLGNLTRMGHGLQRSYLLALLQELASSDAPDAPTLILGCEEPELYQHPPQARHLADVFTQLAAGDNQVLVTTHSPLFVNGDGVENVRLVRTTTGDAGSSVSSVKFGDLCVSIREAMGEDPARKLEGLVAKIHQALQPHIAEMFFSRIPILVEGLEDASYITAALHLTGKWLEFRRLGCHLVPVNGKDKLIQPVAIAQQLRVPIFVVFDADGNTERPEHRVKHEKDNKALMKLLGVPGNAFPDADYLGGHCAIWKTNLTLVVEGDFGDSCSTYKEKAKPRVADTSNNERSACWQF
jgi:putative ATP-dependent endonuclease of OLD family